MKVDVLVLGAGISGLSAAYQLQKRCIGDVRIDSGALFLTNSYQSTFELIKELGMDHEVIPIHTRNGIVARDRIFTLPPHSFVDLVQLLPFSSLLKLPGVLWDVMRHNSELTLENVLKGHLLDTESVQDFAVKHLDPTLLNYVIDPILQGIWYWEAASTTKVALYLLFKQALTMRLYTFRSGMGVLANSLVRGLDVSLETQVIRSKYDSESKTWKTVIRDGGGERTIESSSVLCTLPATCINDIFTELPNTIRTFLGGIKYTSIITMHLLLNETTNIPQYYGLYYPTIGTKAIAAIAIQSNRNLSEPLPGKSAVSIYASTRFSQELLEKPEEEIERVMMSKLEAAYPFSGHGLSQGVLASRIIRVAPALPIFNVGYIQKMKDFQETLVNDLPAGLFFAGDFMGGPHIEGAVISAKQTVHKINDFLQNMATRGTA
jgi:oxygen-dependent protoporphyrinogen oxidase